MLWLSKLLTLEKTGTRDGDTQFYLYNTFVNLILKFKFKESSGSFTSHFKKKQEVCFVYLRILPFSTCLSPAPLATSCTHIFLLIWSLYSINNFDFFFFFKAPRSSGLRSLSAWEFLPFLIHKALFLTSLRQVSAQI